MDERILLLVTGVMLLALILLAIVLFQTRREQKKLKQDCQSLRAQIQRSSDDVAGLCSAAIAVDKRLSDSESYVSRILDHLDSSQAAVAQPNDEVFAEKNEEPQGYGLAIERIKDGASLDDLVKNFGLTRDEAVLLMRLHGKR